MSADQRPAETAARQHREDAAAEVVAQLGQDNHSKAVLAPFPGVSVTDRGDSRPEAMDVPAVDAASSKHTGPPGS